MIEQCATSLSSSTFVTPSEKYRLIRAIPHLMLLADGSLNDGDNNDSNPLPPFNVFKPPKSLLNKLNVPRLQKILKAYPHVPVFGALGDMTITLNVILKRAPNYATEKETQWGYAASTTGTTGKDDALEKKLEKKYSLEGSKQGPNKWKDFRERHINWVATFTETATNLLQTPFTKDPEHALFCGLVKTVVLSGVLLMRDLSCALTELTVWKFAHPATPERLFELGVTKDTDGEYTCSEYERVGRYNYTRPELSVVVDCVSMIKSIAGQLLDASDRLAPTLRLAIHEEIQTLVSIDLRPAMNRAYLKDKKKSPTSGTQSPFLAALLQIRNTAADFPPGHRTDSYKSSSKESPAGPPHATPLPSRCVGASPTQLHVLRAMVSDLCDANSPFRTSKSLFAKRDLPDAEASVLQNFHNESLYYPYLLALDDTVLEVSDLGGLWYREFYLEVSGRWDVRRRDVRFSFFVRSFLGLELCINY